MALRLFLLYVVGEIATVIALVHLLGFGTALLVVIAVFALGLLLAGSQVRRQVARLRGGLSAADAPVAAADSALVALGVMLVVVPGVASSIVGALLLLPPTRALARPAVAAAVRRMPVVTVAGGPARRRFGGATVIDGEVVEPPGPGSGPGAPGVAPWGR